MQVQEIMTQNPSCASPDAPLSQVAQLMKDNDTGIIPICGEENALLGVITDRDIVVRGIAEGCTPDDPVDEIMTSEGLACCSPSDDLDEAARLMAGRQVKRICVTEGNTLVGILSLGDLAVTDEDEAEEALEGISHGAKAEHRAP